MFSDMIAGELHSIQNSIWVGLGGCRMKSVPDHCSGVLAEKSHDSCQPIPCMWRWPAFRSLTSPAKHGFLKLHMGLLFMEASLDGLFGFQCSDCVYHGKNESHILAGRQSAVEEILWCVIHAILEGHQSTGQAERCPLLLKCHQGLGAWFSSGTRSGFQCLRDGMGSQARTDF